MKHPATAAIRRHEIPVDDQWHTLRLTASHILHVHSRRPDVVELWAIHHEGVEPTARAYRAFGTGQPIDDCYLLGHVGTAIYQQSGPLASGARLVWHLFEHLDPARLTTDASEEGQEQA